MAAGAKTLAYVQTAMGDPSFRALVAIIDHRVNSGDSAGALEILKILGSDARVGWQIIESWPTPKNRRLARVGVSLEDEVALRFAAGIDFSRNYNWTNVLTAVLLEAKAVRAREPDPKTETATPTTTDEERSDERTDSGAQRGGDSEEPRG